MPTPASPWDHKEAQSWVEMSWSLRLAWCDFLLEALIHQGPSSSFMSRSSNWSLCHRHLGNLISLFCTSTHLSQYPMFLRELNICLWDFGQNVKVFQSVATASTFSASQSCKEDSAVVWSSKETTGSSEVQSSEDCGKWVLTQKSQQILGAANWTCKKCSCDKPDLCSSCVPSCVPGHDPVFISVLDLSGPKPVARYWDTKHMCYPWTIQEGLRNQDTEL